TDGVDPVGRREIRGLLQELRGRGTTIFLNSHLLSEVERLCDRVCILRAGEVVREGGVEELTRRQGIYEIGLGPDQVLPQEDLRRLGYQVARAGARWEVRPPDGRTIDPVLDLLRDRGLVVRHLAEKRQSLEDLFVEIVDDAEPGVDERRR